MSGKIVRLKRIISPSTGRCFIVPMDHGYTLGPVSGLENMAETLEKIIRNNKINAVIVHKGHAAVGARMLAGNKHIGLIVHLSGATCLAPDPLDKSIVGTVEEALRLGADAVSVHVNIGAESEGKMLSELGRLSEQCNRWNMPLLAMMYPRGKRIEDEYDEQCVAHAVRVAAEIGVDVIKTNYTGSVDSFQRVVRSVGVPVIVAGGMKCDNDQDLLALIQDALEAGARGVAIGRNIFQHDNPPEIIGQIAAVLLKAKDVSVNDAHLGQEFFSYSNHLASG